jgi:hypothetical protein
VDSNRFPFPLVSATCFIACLMSICTGYFLLVSQPSKLIFTWNKEREILVTTEAVVTVLFILE